MTSTSFGTDKAPLVSVVIPVHNGELYIAECLRSIYHQRYDPLEVIVVDDCSSDGTASLCEPFAERGNFTYVRNTVNLGTAESRNRGLSLAKGTFVAFLDADDRWYPSFMTTQMQILAAHPDIRCLCSDFDLIDGEGNVVRPSDAVYESKAKITLRHHGLSSIWDDAQNIIPSTLIADAAVLRQVGGFTRVFAEDINLWLKLAASGIAIAETPVILASYRRHPSQKTSDGYRMTIARAHAYQDAVTRYPEIRQTVGRSRFKKKLYDIYKKAGNYYFWIEGDYRTARRYFRMALAHKPADLDSIVKLGWCITPRPIRLTIRFLRRIPGYLGKAPGR